MKNKQISEFIVNKAKQDTERNCVKMKEIIAAFPTAIPKSSNIMELQNDECEIEYHGYHYKIGFYIPNAEKADPAKSPIIAAGFDVEDNEETKESDIIFGWYLTEAGERQAVNISENDATNTDVPVIISTLEPCGTPSVFKGVKKSIHLENNLPTAEARATAGFFSNEYRVERRYDGTTWSEFRCTGARIKNNLNGTATGLLLNTNAWWQIADVHKNNIGANLSVWKKFCDNFTPYWGSEVVFNTFERDWFGWPKTLGEYTNKGITLTLTANMSYSDDWYTFDPASSLVMVDLQQIHTNWADWFPFGFDENGEQKGRLRIWRVDN